MASMRVLHHFPGSRLAKSRAWSLGFGVWDFGFEFRHLRLRIWDSGFRASANRKEPAETLNPKPSTKNQNRGSSSPAPTVQRPTFSVFELVGLRV